MHYSQCLENTHYLCANYRSCLLETPEERVEGTLTLVGGSGDHEGNVHVNGMPVCHPDWDLPDAWVACKQAGYSGVNQVLKYSHFGQVSSLAIMIGVHCTGNELQLLDCDRFVLK